MYTFIHTVYCFGTHRAALAHNTHTNTHINYVNKCICAYAFSVYSTNTRVPCAAASLRTCLFVYNIHTLCGLIREESAARVTFAREICSRRRRACTIYVYFICSCKPQYLFYMFEWSHTRALAFVGLFDDNKPCTQTHTHSYSLFQMRTGARARVRGAPTTHACGTTYICYDRMKTDKKP